MRVARQLFDWALHAGYIARPLPQTDCLEEQAVAVMLERNVAHGKASAWSRISLIKF